MMELTPRQEEVLQVIRDYIHREKRPPTYREIGAKMNMSLAGVRDHVKALEKKNKIFQNKGSRGIRLIKKEDPFLDWLDDQIRGCPCQSITWDIFLFVKGKYLEIGGKM